MARSSGAGPRLEAGPRLGGGAALGSTPWTSPRRPAPLRCSQVNLRTRRNRPCWVSVVVPVVPRGAACGSSVGLRSAAPEGPGLAGEPGSRGLGTWPRAPRAWWRAAHESPAGLLEPGCARRRGGAGTTCGRLRRGAGTVTQLRTWSFACLFISTRGRLPP